MILTTKDLVEKFGNKKQKDIYKSSGTLQSNTKKSILNNAKKYCNIIDKGRGDYEIIEFYDVPIPKQLFTIKENEIYKVFCPLIIHKLIGRHDKNNALTSSLINYYGGMQIIHKDNYNTIRYNTKIASKELNLDIENIYKFYSSVNGYLKYYLEKSLDLLKAMNILIWYRMPYLKKRDIHVINNPSSVNLKVDNIHRRATAEEVQLNLDIKKTIRDKYNIIDDKDLFFNKLYKEAKREYEEELIKHNIVYFYEGYEVYYDDIEKVKLFMNNFLDFNYNEYSNKLSDTFIKNVLENTENRHEFSEELIKVKSMSDFKYLCENTLKFDVEDVVLSENIININDGDYHSYTSIIYENN